METQAVDQVQLAGSVANVDLSIWGLFMHADMIGKTVILGLFIVSILTWAVIFDKGVKLRRLVKRAVFFEDRFWSGVSLDALYEKVGRYPADPIQAVFVAGMKEWHAAAEKGQLVTAAARAGLQSRIDRVVAVTIAREMTQLETWMTFLASVGSVAPFVGLFGTVWGIMHSFIGIAGAQNTSLAVVAPGIAEALFATAIGLVAAIPATAAYNKFATEIGRYNERLDNFASDFSALLSRNLEEQRLAA